MIRCLVFDFDGVLVDSNAVKRRAYFDVFSAAPGAETFVEEALRAHRFGTRYDVIGAVVRRLGARPMEARAAVALYAGRYNAICEAYAATCAETPGTSECLGTLARRYPLYVDSATPEEPLQRVIATRGWSGVFRGVFGSPATKADNLRRAMRDAAVEVERVLFVGDREADRRAAVECGCRFVGMENEGNDFDATVTMIADLREIEPLLATVAA